MVLGTSFVVAVMPETYTDVRASIHHVRVADITITAFLSASNFKGKSLEQFNRRSRVAQWLRWQKNKVQKSDEEICTLSLFSCQKNRESAHRPTPW